MLFTEIEAIEADWDKFPVLFPLPGRSYLIKIDSELEMRLSSEIWITFCQETESPDNGHYLCQGTVLKADPPTTPPGKEQTILFHLNEIIPEEAILLTFPEMEYAVALNTHLQREYSGCAYTGNVLDVCKLSAGSYSVNVDYYGNSTKILIKMYEGKMYAWKTKIGFDFFRSYYGKYLVPQWLMQKIDDPSGDGYIRYYDETF